MSKRGEQATRQAGFLGYLLWRGTLEPGESYRHVIEPMAWILLIQRLNMEIRRPGVAGTRGYRGWYSENHPDRSFAYRGQYRAFILREGNDVSASYPSSPLGYDPSEGCLSQYRHWLDTGLSNDLCCLFPTLDSLVYGLAHSGLIFPWINGESLTIDEVVKLDEFEPGASFNIRDVSVRGCRVFIGRQVIVDTPDDHIPARIQFSGRYYIASHDGNRVLWDGGSFRHWKDGAAELGEVDRYYDSLAEAVDHLHASASL